jgi:glycogen debranching enzyme
MVGEMPHGLFFGDSRVISTWAVTVAGGPVEPLTVSVPAPFSATFVGRVHPGGRQADTGLIVMRRRQLGSGMREVIRLENFSTSPATLELCLETAADFADLFEVKESRVPHRPIDHVGTEPGRLWFEQRRDGVSRRVDLVFDVAPELDGGRAVWCPTIEPRGSFEVAVEVTATVAESARAAPAARTARAAEAERRFDDWRARTPTLRTDDWSLARSFTQAIDDLGALRMFDPEHPESPVVAAGAPWFMALFGRDSLISAWMALLVDPTLARGVLDTLARLQGTDVDPATEEEPGRILHEVRFGTSASLALGAGSIYYGSIDATPLFVMLAGELSRWGLAGDALGSILPAVDRALEWITTHGDRDGDGYVEYQRSTERGLRNQGWKDSWDAIAHADGRLAEPPIALCEVQGYVYAAHRARAHLAAVAGDHDTARRHQDVAEDLKRRFNEDFWMPEQRCFAIGLDADKRPIDAVTSNIGHCLWTGIVDDAHAGDVAACLLSPELFSGWGIRTLATSMARYNPVSYHNGSVWPHDTALAAAGLVRYGFVDEAHRVIRGLLDVADLSGGRLPELFAGFDRAELDVPAAYPTSCSPQAWAAAAPLLLTRALLRLDPDADLRRLHVDPVPLPQMGHLGLVGLDLAGARRDLGWQDGKVQSSGFDGWSLIRSPRPATGGRIA